MWVYSKYITTKNGVRIYPQNASCFRFWVDDEEPDDVSQKGTTEGSKTDTKSA